eukprot:2817341-Prymnesium_polylepis.1
MGTMRYDYSIIREILKIPCKPAIRCTLTIDGGEPTELDLMVLTIMNNKRSGVGLRISPAAQLDDGRLDV